MRPVARLSVAITLADKIPISFLDLVNCPKVAALTTVMPDGTLLCV